MDASCSSIFAMKQSGVTLSCMLKIDYFDQVGCGMITDHGICEAFYERYVAVAKTELLWNIGYYELGKNLSIQKYMLHGSLHDSLQMVDYSNVLCYLGGCCMHDMKGYIRYKSNPLQINKKSAKIQKLYFLLQHLGVIKRWKNCLKTHYIQWQ